MQRISSRASGTSSSRGNDQTAVTAALVLLQEYDTCAGFHGESKTAGQQIDDSLREEESKKCSTRVVNAEAEMTRAQL